jgi:hypothetical protein
MRASIGTNSTGWHPYNMQVVHITGAPTAEGMNYGSLAPDALKRAKASVDLAFHVGVVEQYAASLCLAAWRITPRAPRLGTFCSCDAVGGKLNHLDHGANTHAIVPSLGEEELVLIHELTRKDQQLYAYARARFFADVGSSPLPRCLLSAGDPEPIPPFALPRAAGVEGVLALAPSDGASCRPTLPTVLILGSQKCATTSLHTSLVANFGLAEAHVPDHAGGANGGPGWVIPRNKRKPKLKTAGARMKGIHFFDTSELYARGAEAYAGLFPRSCGGGGGGAPLVGIDSTPSYLTDPAVPGRMRAFFAQHASDSSTRHLRLVAVVRDPTERLRSAYDMMARSRKKHNSSNTNWNIDKWALSLLLSARRCCEAAGIDAAAADALHGACFDQATPLAGGMYAPPLAAYAQAFAPRQMALVAYGGYSRDPTAVLCELAVFSGVRPTGCAGMALKDGTAAAGVHASNGAQTASAGGARDSVPLALKRNAHQTVHVFSPSSRAKVNNFYAPHRAHVVRLLGTEAMQEMTVIPFGGGQPRELTDRMLFSEGHGRV